MAADSRRLVDVLLRHQLYLEGVKVWYARQFTRVLQELSVELRKLFARLPYETLDALTKAQLHAFVRQLREVQAQHYNRYVIVLLDDLREFMQVDLDVSKILFASFVRRDPLPPEELLGNFFAILNEWEDETEEHSGLVPFAWLRGGDDNVSRFWGTVKNAPIPATGMLLTAMLSSFIGAANGTITNTVMKGYANKEKTSIVAGALSGAISKVSAQGAAVTDTLLQHIDSIVQTAVASVFYDQYQWLSIIDSSTTDICRSRNKRIYRYGSGPLPPAHMRCRSKTAPYVGTGYDGPLSFTSWLKAQPKSVRDDISVNPSALTHKQFRAKSALMLAGEA